MKSRRERLELRLNILRQFTFGELSTLIAGKVLSFLRSENFKMLQQKENRLAIVFANSTRPTVAGENVQFYFQRLPRKVGLKLRLTGSDVQVFKQVLIDECYKSVHEIYERVFQGKPRSIVDAGANIGLASVYFSILNLDSRILAIEPDRENAESARQHFKLNKLESIDLRRAALWPVSSLLSLVNDFRDKANWSLRVEQQDQGEIQSLTPQDVLDYFGGTVDLFKIDIEGAESHIFKKGNSFEWLRHVKLIAIEVHEEYIAQSLIKEILERHGFQVRVSGELTIGTNLKFINEGKTK